jgi:hypothetical protein
MIFRYELTLPPDASSQIDAWKGKDLPTRDRIESTRKDEVK